MLFKSDKVAAKLARKESLQMKLAQRPDRQELIDKNIIPSMSEDERHDFKEAIGNKLNRRLSLRPTAEELEQRNILRQQSIDQLRQEKEETRKILIRKVRTIVVFNFLYSSKSYFTVKLPTYDRRIERA